MRLLRSFSPDPVSDLLASFVVVLVALPLCMGIAIASGAPPAAGLVTGVVGGLIVGLFAGSPLQVSGPAAGLAVIVFEIVAEHGFGALGPILLLAGALQLAAGWAGLGRWFRAISPAVVYGMLAGIGVLIAVAQLHVMVDGRPQADGLANLAAIPAAFLGGVLPLDGSRHEAALVVGLATVALILGWERWKPGRLRLLPGALIGVAGAAALANLGGLEVAYIDVPRDITQALSFPGWAGLGALAGGDLLVTAVAVAFIASAETLLSATAVDQMRTGPRTRYNRELGAQGIGNMLCGALGALPMTGVIVRSSANVQAGAVSRLSTVLHGLWLAIFVLALPDLLRLIPTSSLGAVLVLTGYKLVDPGVVRKLAGYGRFPLLIYAATLVTIVLADLLTGVLVGLALSLAELVYKAAALRVDLHPAGDHRVELDLDGTATFLQTPVLARSLEEVPADTTLHVRTGGLTYVDHAAQELFASWARQNEERGCRLEVDWGATGQKTAHATASGGGRLLKR